MAVVNFFIQGVEAKKFSGGLLCIFEYANAIAKCGHQVNMIPLEPSEYPEWFDYQFNLVMHRKNSGSLASWFASQFSGSRNRRRAAQKDLMLNWSKKAGYSFQRAAHIEALKSAAIPEADITIATSYLTALPVHLFGTGKKYYFIQHFEPYFAIDSQFPEMAQIDAWQTYNLPLNIIANSSWLAKKIKVEFGKDVEICLNAINFEQFYPSPSNKGNTFTVLSYGGRKVKWKGFSDAAKAVQLARKEIPELVWQVYGDAELQPENDIAPYIDLGFISGAAIREAYSNADVVLCPSWYESFPLYPIEGMACGAAVITTPFGTEDYAVDRHNALIVPAQNPVAMAAAIVELYKDKKLRLQLSENAATDAKNFTWEKSTTRIKEILGL